MATTSACEFRKRNLALLSEKLGRSVAVHSIEKHRLNIVKKDCINSDGSILLGTAESKFLFDDGKTLKMTVTPKMVTDTPFTNAPFDTFPVHCPDHVVWGILNEVGRSR